MVLYIELSKQTIIISIAWINTEQNLFDGDLEK